MAGLGGVLDQAINAPPMPTVPENGSARNATRQSSQNSTGACDACRLRKVRCLPNESSSGRCQRCARANKDCVYTAHSKTRRRKRTDTRVKELEEKVRGLSMLLENGRGGSASNPGRDIEGMGDENGNRKRTLIEKNSPVPTGGDMSPWKGFIDQSQTRSSISANSILQSWEMVGEDTSQDPKSPDVIERGLLSMNKATELVDRYNSLLMPHYPAVPISCPAHELRKTKPILFLAVLAASADTSEPVLHVKLNQEIQELYARKITVQGQKSIELIQALCVSILWPYPPKNFKELKFHQQIHMAATMALDLGLGKRPKPVNEIHQTQQAIATLDLGEPGKGDASYQILKTREAMAKKRASDSNSVEGRRALLACYVFCASTSINLRLSNMLRFTNWMAECVEFFETSPEAAPTDKRFIAWVKLQHIVEDCAMALGLDESDDTLSLDDERAQLMLKGAEKQLAAWKTQITSDPETLNDLLEICYHVNKVNLHEIALHAEHDADEFRPPFSLEATRSSSKRLSPPYINAIMVCISSSQRLIDVFLGMSVEALRASPRFLWTRLCYAVVILMKLSISASTPSSELGKIIDPEECKVLYYSERVIAYMDKIATTSGLKQHDISFRFLRILNNLNFWYRKHTLQLNATDGKDKTLGSGKTALAKHEPEKLASDVGVSGSQDSTPYMSSRASMTSDSQATSRHSHPAPYNPQPPSQSNFFQDTGNSCAGNTSEYNALEPAPAPTSSAQAPSWPHGFQPSPANPESGYSSTSIPNGPYDFPIDLDPNFFSQLFTKELYETGVGVGDYMLNGEDGMDYTNMSDTDWTNWPQLL